ncbi:MAG: DNA polymerase III subunit delta' [Burkholderiaceae bacterium]|nr:DNA polymerase III subunit delta' [Burkholderiaceae bacterium]
MAIGVGADGRLPLPWLGDALARSAALAGAHALLVHGPAGAGHLEFALLLAQAVLCEAGGDEAAGRPCGRCSSCHLVATRVHPDLLIVLPDALRVQLGWVDDEDGRLTKADAKPSRDLRVEQVRQAIGWSQRTSGRGRGKVLLLHPADAMNAAAANALLKTLEEPPGSMRLLLTSADPERLLPTVRSRCQRLRLGLPAADQALDWLQAQGVDEAPALLAVAGGSPLEAQACAREGLTAAWLAALPRRVAAGDASPLVGRALPRAIELLLKLAHDAQVQAAGGAPRFFSGEQMPGAADPAALREWQRALLRAARHDEHPWNAGLLVESLVGQAAAVWPHAPGRATSRAGASLHSGR